MQNKFSVLKKKYEKIEKKHVFFCYFPNAKAKNHKSQIRNIVLNKLYTFTLPSKFKIVKKQNVQNPQIFIVYGNKFNFNKIKFLKTKTTLNFLINNKMYSPLMLKEANYYFNSQNVCEVFVNNIKNVSFNLLTSFSYFISSKIT